MILVKIDRNSSTPVYYQIVKQVQKLIERDVLQPGDKLPSSRELASKLGLHRSTTYRAYEELWALGYIKSHPGSYTRVRKRTKVVSPDLKKSKGILDWDLISSKGGHSVFDIFQMHKPEVLPANGRNCINFAQLDIDRRLFPLDDFRRCMNTIMSELGQKVIGYSDFRGYRPLKRYIASRMQRHGVSASEEEILITNGSQQGLELILKLLVDPGQSVVVESPSYSNIFPLLRFFQARITEVPMTSEGLDLESLEQALNKQKPALIYTIPNFQNPTGLTTSQLHREKLLSLCEKHTVPLLEDGFEEEMKYFGKVTLPIRSMDKSNLVMYVGTFSKVLIPGIRIGWINAERECIERLTAIKRFGDISSQSLGQAALFEFCRRGLYDLHIKRMHRIYRKRMQTMLQALSENVSRDHAEWTEPTGGYLLWMNIKKHSLTDEEIRKIFLDHELIVSLGRYYNKEYTDVPAFRLSISTLDEAEIKEGVQRLAKAIDFMCS